MHARFTRRSFPARRRTRNPSRVALSVRSSVHQPRRDRASPLIRSPRNLVKRSKKKFHDERAQFERVRRARRVAVYGFRKRLMQPPVLGVGQMSEIFEIFHGMKQKTPLAANASLTTKLS